MRIAVYMSRALNCAVLAASIALLALLSACPKQVQESTQSQPAGTDSGAAKLKVLCTTSIIADCARKVGGDNCDVSSLMGPGVDPHLYKARESDLSRLAEADLILYNGLHLEAKLADVLEDLGERRPCVAVSAGIPAEMLLADESGASAHDPHIWFDASLWTTCVGNISSAMAKADPANAEAYQQRSIDYTGEVLTLHKKLLDDAQRIPEAQRVLVTSHDAFRYFGRAYGFEVRGLQGISTQSEAGTADVQQLIDFVVQRKIPAIFIETSVSPRNIQAVQEGCRAKGWEVKIGGELFSDALGNPGTLSASYLGMLDHNMSMLVVALSGDFQDEGAAGGTAQ